MELGGYIEVGTSAAGTKEKWKIWWIVLWVVTTATWIAVGLSAPGYGVGVATFAVLFGPQEWFALRDGRDAYPPLTHVIRTQLKSYLAFPLIFAVVAALGCRWADLPWDATGKITVPVAALGWLTEHFIATFNAPDPREPDGPGPIRPTVPDIGTPVGSADPQHRREVEQRQGRRLA